MNWMRHWVRHTTMPGWWVVLRIQPYNENTHLMGLMWVRVA